MSVLLEQFVNYSESLDEFCEVSCRLLEGLLGREAYSRAKRTLLEAGIIEVEKERLLGGLVEVEKSYSYHHAGAHCIRYRFDPSISVQRADSIKLSDRLGQRFLANKRRVAKRAAGSTPEGWLIWANLMRLTLHPDYVAAIPDFAARLAAIGQKTNRKTRKRLYSELRRQAAWQIAAASVINQSFFFTQARNSGRVYNSFTSFPKELRRYALLDGEPTVEIDIRNSQPLFLAQFYPGDSVEGQKYRALVKEGRLYEEIQTAAAAAGIELDRDQTKKRLYAQVLFGKNNKHYELLAVFRSVFPELAQFVWDLKRREGFKQLAVELQKREATVMINRVIPRLAILLPGVPVLPVHDSLVVPVEHARLAEKVIEEEVFATTGIKPSLRATFPKG